MNNRGSALSLSFKLISGEVDWQPAQYAVSAGIYTLKWVYAKDSSGYSGDDCDWVDYVQFIA